MLTIPLNIWMHNIEPFIPLSVHIVFYAVTTTMMTVTMILPYSGTRDYIENRRGGFGQKQNGKDVIKQYDYHAYLENAQWQQDYNKALRYIDRYLSLDEE